MIWDSSTLEYSGAENGEKDWGRGSGMVLSPKYWSPEASRALQSLPTGLRSLQNASQVPRMHRALSDQIRIADIRSQILLPQQYPARDRPAARGVPLKIKSQLFSSCLFSKVPSRSTHTCRVATLLASISTSQNSPFS